MTSIAYTVTCTITDPQKAEEWIAWLKDGHIQDVLDGGAGSAVIVRHDQADQSDPITFEVRYIFDNRETLDLYLENHAPRLRDEGLKRFPPEDGFSYSRSIGEIISR